MPADKYKFISPGVFLHEIDNTGRPQSPGDVGPALIGRSPKGPILKPIKINSYADFITTFGEPVPGAKGGDISRDGNYTAPTYAPYAAQAWFRNSSPLTYVRLGGQAHEDAAAGGEAGWRTTNTAYTTNDATNGGAYSLFVADCPSVTYMSGALTASNATIVADSFIQFTGAFGNMRQVSCSMEDPPVINQFQFVTGAAGLHDNAGLAANIVASINHADAGGGLSQIVSASVSVDGFSKTPPALVQFDVITGGLPSLFPVVEVTSSPGGFSTGIEIARSVAAEGWFVPAGGPMGLSGAFSAVTGCLAATWYLDENLFIGLSGTYSMNGGPTVGSSIYIDSVGFRSFNVQIAGPLLTPLAAHSDFSFTSTDSKYIRQVFNTNPTLANPFVTTTVTDYWLGESYEGMVNQVLQGTSDSSRPQHIGVILPMRNAANFGGNFEKSYQNAETGWFFSQDMAIGEAATASYDPAQMQRLFKLVARNSGDWVARNFKVSIKDLKRSSNVFDKYGSFTVALRKMDDTDNRVDFVEQFNNCTLNPHSENFIGRKIGDRFVDWNEEDRAYTEFGDYPNMSQYVRVELPEIVKKGDTDPRLLPFGVRGPLRFASFQDLTGNQMPSFVSGNFDDTSIHIGIKTFITGATNGAIQFDFPLLRMRISASEGNPTDLRNTYFGVDTTFGSGERLEESVVDHLKIKPFGISDFNASTSDSSSVSYFFTLDDMCNTATTLTGTNVYISGSRNGIDRGNLEYVRGTGSYVRVLEGAGVDRFTTVFFGGFDGLNIKEAEPFSNRLLDGATPKTSYEFNSVQVAIDSLKDPEVVQYDLAAMPGIKNNTLNRSLVDLCESRGDALAIIDIKHAYDSAYENVFSDSARHPNVNAAILDVRNNLAINSSYGATYFPWVQISDITNGQLVWVPPSVVALGAISAAQKASELWFAPAGYSRGSLSNGQAGIPVRSARMTLTSQERDKLYAADINPIATFPKEGIVIFGQKTLKANQSALDRINVRRLLIFLKRRVSHFAATLLFSPNVRTTWNRFRGTVEPFLAGVQARLGIAEFELTLDETTTTPELVARNIMYAKLYIKPVRAIEFIAIDFILTDSGAAFED